MEEARNLANAERYLAKFFDMQPLYQVVDFLI